MDFSALAAVNCSKSGSCADSGADINRWFNMKLAVDVAAVPLDACLSRRCGQHGRCNLSAELDGSIIFRLDAGFICSQRESCGGLIFSPALALIGAI